MPKLLESFPELEQSMLRPGIIEITHQLMQLTAISPQTRILFTGPQGETYQPGSTITPPEEETNTFEHDDRLTIEVDQDFQLDGLLTRAVLGPDAQMIFRDDLLQIWMRPMYAPLEITINFKYKAKSLSEGQRWRTLMRNRVAQSQIQHLHDMSYHYLIPGKFLGILDEVVKLREKTAGYGENLLQYIMGHITPKATLKSDLAGRNERWAIAETQQRIQGWFDFDGYPEKGERENNGDTVTMSFGYHFSLEAPIAAVMSWPLMIHQSIIKYYDPKPVYQLEAYARNFSLSGMYSNYFEQGNGPTAALVTRPFERGVLIPEFDEFIPDRIVWRTFRLVTGMIGLSDPTQPLLDFNQLGDYDMDDEVLAFLKKEAVHINKGSYYSIFTLSLYRNSKMIPNPPLRIDADGKVWLEAQLSLRDYHHIRLGIVYDLTLLQPGVIDRIIEDGPPLIKIIDWIDPTLKDRDLLPGLNEDGSISRPDIDKVIDDISKDLDGVGDNQTRKMKTVEILSIIALKMKELQ